MADRINAPVSRPPSRLYEVRTCHSGAYRAEGDVIESGEGWLTLWSDEQTIALRIPEADVRSLRQVDSYEDDLPGAEPLSEQRVRELIGQALADEFKSGTLLRKYGQARI